MPDFMNISIQMWILCVCMEEISKSKPILPIFISDVYIPIRTFCDKASNVVLCEI